MGSTNFTTHYDIPLPLGSDKTTPMDYNESMQAVDAALFEAHGNASSAVAGLEITNGNVAQNANDIDALERRMTTAEGTLVTQGNAINNLGLDVADVRADGQDMICAYKEASAQSTHNYSVGDYFIYNDVLYKATESISVGDTITPDTNCRTTNVTSEIIDKTEVNAITLVPVSPTGITINNDKSVRSGNIVNINTKITINADRTAGNALVGLPEGITPYGVVGTSTQFNATLNFSKISGGTAVDIIGYEWQKLGDSWYINLPTSTIANDVILINGSVMVQ